MDETLSPPQDKPQHYTVLARRFRPQTFDEVVGQQHVARALRNAIQNGRVAHAYLFTGARGVGKTSMARIIAKALNCPQAAEGRPCNACDICHSITAGHDVDVLEIDGASNRGIDDIRSLRATISVKSMRTRYKMYIIDEVHMLTREAFNALLKTLEEPPPNVIFVFCTTDPNKVPETILSRCQRFDFTTIETANIIARLEQIARAEGYEVEPAALELVARRAAGSMRDSQSLFDQLLAFGDERIRPADVHRLLGTASDERLIELAEALVDRRSDAVLRLLDQALAEGVQLGELVGQMLAYLRDLMVLAAGAEVPLHGVSPESRPRLVEQAGRWGLHTALAAIQILAEARAQMMRVTYGRAVAEMAFVRIALLEDLESLDRLIHEVRHGNGSVSATAPAARLLPAASPSESHAAEKKKLSPADAEPDPRDSEPPPTNSGEDSEKELWPQVMAQLSPMLKAHAQAAHPAATSGPNDLDLMFPASYDFSKQYCERPEVVAELERLASRSAGRPIRIRFQIEEGEPQAAPPEPEPREATPARRPSDSVTDPFVNRAMAVFGATVVRVDGLSAPAEE